MRRSLLLLFIIVCFMTVLSSCKGVALETGASGCASADVITGYPIIFKTVYATGNNHDTPVRYSFIELYNKSNRDISLEGKALGYCAGNDTAYAVYPFSEGMTIPANGSFLIRCAEAKDEEENAYISACEKFTLDTYDADFPLLTLSSKRLRLILTEGTDTVHTQKENGSDLFENKHVLAYFGACADDASLDAPVNGFGLSKTTAFRRSQDLSAWETVTYTALDCLSLDDYLPSCSTGVACSLPESAITVIPSTEGGRYEKAVSVSLETYPGWEIYYSLDANESRSSFRKYTGPITVSDTEVESIRDGYVTTMLIDTYGSGAKTKRVSGLYGTVLRAYAKCGSEIGPMMTETYFVTPDIADYDGILMCNITLDAEDFVGEEGIYSTVNHDIFDTRYHCDGYLEILEQDGTRPVSTYVQLAMNGNGSLGFNQKSMRVYVCEESTPRDGGTIHYDLFAGDALDADGNVITEYKTFIFRNSGNDASCSMLRDGVMQRLSRSVNAAIQAYRPCLLYINGELWGLYNIRERYSTSYFESHYGIDPDNLVMLESVSPLLTGSWNTAYELNEGVEGDEQDFYDIVDYVAEHDMKDDAEVAWVEERMDLDNFIDFFIASCYMANTDWPGNNIKVWRNKNPEDPSGLDTRWRWVLSDMDFGLGHSTSPTQQMFDHALTEDTVCGKLMTRLLKNINFRLRFADRAIELCNTIFKESVTIPVLEEAAAAIEPYVDINFDRWREDGGSVDNWNHHIDLARNFLKKRTASFCSSLERACKVYAENITCTAEHATVSINDCSSENGKITYYARDGVCIDITATAEDGYSVTGFDIKVGAKTTHIDGTSVSIEVIARTTVTVITEKIS